MKKIFLALIFSFATLQSSPVIDFVEEIVDKDSFRKHSSLIKKIFQNEKRFMYGKSLKILLILDKLKTNGILKIFLKNPTSIKISFKGSGGNPLFFTKILSDSLQELGYFKYRIIGADYDSSGFVWTIEFTSKYILDPTLLYRSLANKQCRVLNINRYSDLKWEYLIDIENAVLNVQKLEKNYRTMLKTPVFDYWLNIQNGTKLFLKSRGNKWHPHITFYDKHLHLIKVIKQDTKTVDLVLKIPKSAIYARITDIYMLSNLKNGLRVTLK
jgi:hypothetical protein